MAQPLTPRQETAQLALVAEHRVYDLFSAYIQQSWLPPYRTEFLTTAADSFYSTKRAVTNLPSDNKNPLLKEFLDNIPQYFVRASPTAKGNPGTGWKADILALILSGQRSLSVELVEITTQDQADKTAKEDIIKHLNYLRDVAVATELRFIGNGFSAPTLSVYASTWRPQSIDELFYYIAPTNKSDILDGSTIVLKFLSLVPTLTYVPNSVSLRDSVNAAGYHPPLPPDPTRPGLDGLILYEVKTVRLNTLDLSVVTVLVAAIKKMLDQNLSNAEIKAQLEKWLQDKQQEKLLQQLQNTATLIGEALFLALAVMIAVELLPFLIAGIAAILALLAEATATGLPLAAGIAIATILLTAAGEKVASAALPKNLPPSSNIITIRKTLQLP
jgi:hypothetical protein